MSHYLFRTHSQIKSKNSLRIIRIKLKKLLGFQLEIQLFFILFRCQLNYDYLPIQIPTQIPRLCRALYMQLALNSDSSLNATANLVTFTPYRVSSHFVAI